MIPVIGFSKFDAVALSGAPNPPRVIFKHH